MEQFVEWFDVLYLIAIKLGVFYLAVHMLKQWRGVDGIWDKSDSAQLVFLVGFVWTVYVDGTRKIDSDPQFDHWFYLMLFTVVLSIAKLESVIELFGSFSNKVKDLVSKKQENKEE